LLILIAPESSAKCPAVLVSSHSEEADKPFHFILVRGSGTNGFPELVRWSRPLCEPKRVLGNFAGQRVVAWTAALQRCCPVRRSVTALLLLSEVAGDFASHQQCMCVGGLVFRLLVK